MRQRIFPVIILCEQCTEFLRVKNSRCHRFSTVKEKLISMPMGCEMRQSGRFLAANKVVTRKFTAFVFMNNKDEGFLCLSGIYSL